MRQAGTSFRRSVARSGGGSEERAWGQAKESLLRELGVLKQKYGLSMPDGYDARGIWRLFLRVSTSHCVSTSARRDGETKNLTVIAGAKRPKRLVQMVYRANAEGIMALRRTPVEFVVNMERNQ